MKRLGDLVPNGAVHLPGAPAEMNLREPLEFEVAVSRAAEVPAFLAVLRALGRNLSGPENEIRTLNGLVGPELLPMAFDDLYREAIEAENVCVQVRASL
jgi:hypothetical protein